MNILQAITWVAGSLFVLFETTAVYEYLKVLPLPNFITKFKDYENEKKYDSALSYRMYWLINHDSFFIKMITCPYCLGAWASIGFSMIFSCFEWIPAVYLGGLSTYFIVAALLKKLERMNSQYD
jgi:hypothetical protein